MGRQEASLGLAPPTVRKQQRAKEARLTVNKTIPALLAADARARKGVEQAVLIRDPIGTATTDITNPKKSRPKAEGRKSHSRKDSQIKGDADAKSVEPVADRSTNNDAEKEVRQPSIQIRCTDSLTAAYDLHTGAGRSSRNVGLLNMASALRPGGGVLQGATSQEEFLCTRTTLLPSLKDEYYRLPDVGGILTRDCLVFRLPNRGSEGNADNGAEGDRELGRNERFYIDIVSASMLRLPELSGDGEEVGIASQKDADLVIRKMEAVRDILLQHGVRKVVLGAWGCGAYGNPVAVIARSWKKVLLGPKKSNDGDVKGFIEVVFAIKERRMATAFAEAWGDNIQISVDENDVSSEEDPDEANARELDERIEQMRAQLEATKFPMMRDRLSSVLDGLIRQRQGSMDADGSE